MRFLNVINPSAPTLKGLPKIHKDNVPIRPLVNYTCAPTYKLAKKLEKLLKQHLVFDKNYSLKNSYDFIDKTKETTLKQHQQLVSFDVENLYTNVPVGKTIELVTKNLREKSNLLPEAINEISILLTEVLKQNYFMFDGKIYVQTNGLAMGSPLSGILSEVYLNYIENAFIFSDNNKYKNKILFYHRYVDDTIVLFDGNTRQINLLLKYLNNIEPHLKFTVETEKSDSINFLDLKVKKINNKLDFSIFRKPTTTDQTIHSTSYHPHSQKIAAYNSMVYRLLNVPMTNENYNKELRIIEHIASVNGYNSKMIARLIEKQNKRKKSNLTNKDQEKVVYACVNYNHRLHNNLNRELQKHGVRLTYKTSNKVSNILCVGNKKLSSLEKCGVYRLNCGECPCLYIGQTGRSFETRYKEHHPIPKLDKQKSTFAQHLIDLNHTMGDINNLEVLHCCPKSKRLDTLEEFEIYKALKYEDKEDNVLNEKLQFKSNVIFNIIMSQKTKPVVSPHPVDSPGGEEEVT